MEILEDETKLIERRISNGEYNFTNYKERLILRGAHREPRQISIPTVRDRLCLRALCQVLHTFVPDTRGASPHTLVTKVVKSIRNGDQSAKSFVRVDVKNFFPSISHTILHRELTHFNLESMIQDLSIRAVSGRTGSADSANKRGIPQGLSVSGALAALYMLRFDALQINKNSNYVRYVDDILLICDTNKAEDVLKSIGRALKSRGLIIHKKGVEGKTEISPVNDGVDFLGYRISVDKVSVRSSSFRRMFKNLLKIITDYRYKKDVEKLIFRINLKITGCIVDQRRRGWMMFFSHTENMSQLAHLDAFLKDQLARVKFPSTHSNQIKKFIKSYNKIKFTLESSKYIPNFDNYDFDEKAQAISALSSKSFQEIQTWDILTIDEEFSRLISREVHDLEQDVGNPS